MRASRVPVPCWCSLCAPPVVAQQLQKMLVGFGAAFASKNMTLAGSYFLDTGVFLSDGYQPVVGRPGT